MSKTTKISRKWALLIGINDYQGFSKLTDCVNDAVLMGDILQNNFGFPSQNVNK